MKLATLAIFAAMPALASSKPAGLRLKSESTAATASIMYTSAGGLQLSASKCVDRSSFCGRYKRTDCPQSKAAIASSIKVANINGAPMFIHLLKDGTLTFDVGTNGCVNPVASWSGEPTHGALLQDGTSSAFIAASGTGLDLMSSNGFSVQGGAIEPGCTCTNGIAHTDSCMAHEDHHCASCEPGFWLDGKTCTPFTVCKAGEHEAAAPVQTKSNRVCTENDSGTFTSTSGQVTAVTWRTCGTGEGMVSEGTSTKDRECGQCELGKSFSDSNDGEPCTEVDVCTDGEYEHDAPTLTSDRTCATHAAECSSHEYESQAPSGTQDRQCKANVCHCPNGSHTTSWACPKHGDPMCAYCTGAYHLANGNRQCDANICSCMHGAVATGAACTVHGATKCTSCNEGYQLDGQNCVASPVCWNNMKCPNGYTRYGDGSACFRNMHYSGGRLNCDLGYCADSPNSGMASCPKSEMPGMSVVIKGSISNVQHCLNVPNGHSFKGVSLGGKRLCCPRGWNAYGDGSGCTNGKDYCYTFGNDLGSSTPHPCPSVLAVLPLECVTVPNGYSFKGVSLGGKRLCCPKGWNKYGDGSGCTDGKDYCYTYGNDLGSSTPHPCPSVSALM